MLDAIAGDHESLGAPIAAWLARAGRQVNPDFPPALEALYETETAPGRVRAMKFCTMAGCLTGVAMIPFLWLLMPDVHRLILVAWLGAAIPVGLLCHALLWTRLKLAAQEWQIAVAGLLIGGCYSLVMAETRFAAPSVYMGGIVLLILLDAVTGGLRFRPVCLLVAGLFTIFAVTLPNLAGMSWPGACALYLVVLNIAGYALFGNWRLETEMRRTYAMALRERHARTALARDNAALDDLAGRDALTTLANRRTYNRWLSVHWARAALGQEKLGLVVIDIDHFKAFNDHYGHAAGDACLQSVASCLRDQLRGLSDHVARLGGEEFAVLLPGLTLELCGDVAERLRVAVAALELPHLGDANGIVTVSCGAASLAAAGTNTPETLFAVADAALYAAKDGGRNCVRLGEARCAGEAAMG